MNRCVLGILAASLLVAGCAGRAQVPPAERVTSGMFEAPSQTVDTNGGEWPEFRRDDQRTGNNPYQTAITTTNVSTLKPKWMKKTAGIFASPIVVNGVVYEGDLAGNLFAWKLSTGAQLWSFKSTGTFIGSSYYQSATKTIYAGATGDASKNISANFYSINAATGTANWNYTVPNLADLEGSPLVANGLVYEGTSDKDESKDECDINKQLVALNPTTGKLVSSLNISPSGLTGGDIWSAPAIDPSNNVYVTTGNECTANIVPFKYAQSILQIKQGKPTLGVQWSFQSLAGPGDDLDFGATPIYINGMIVETGKDGYTYALNATTGQEIWETQTGAAIGSSATDGTRVYIPSLTLEHPHCMIGIQCGNFVAVNLSDGSIAWKIPVVMGAFHYAEVTAPAVTNGIVFAAFNGHIWALNASTGNTLWSYAVPHVIFGGITIVNGGVLVGEYPAGGEFYCFTPNGT